MRTYKKVGLDPRSVRAIQCQVTTKDIGQGHILMQTVIPPLQPKRYAITLTTSDKRTFNRLLKRLGK